MKRIVIAVDGSEISRDLAEYAFHYAHREGDAELIFLHVVEPPNLSGFESGQLVVNLPSEEERKNQARTTIEARLRDAKQTFPFDVPHLSVVVTYGAPYMEIVDFAKARDADMIMIGHRGLSGVERFFLGSVASKVVSRAPCSVYVHRPKGSTGEYTTV